MDEPSKPFRIRVADMLFNYTETKAIRESHLRLLARMAYFAPIIGVMLIVVTGINELRLLLRHVPSDWRNPDTYLLSFSMLLLVAGLVAATTIYAITYHLYAHARNLENKYHQMAKKPLIVRSVQRRWIIMLFMIIGFIFEFAVNSIAFAPVATGRVYVNELDRVLNENIQYIYALLIAGSSFGLLTIGLWHDEISQGIANYSKAIERHKQHAIPISQGRPPQKNDQPATPPESPKTLPFETPHVGNGKSDIMRNDHPGIVQRLATNKVGRFNVTQLAQALGWSVSTASRAINDEGTGLLAQGVVQELQGDPKLFGLNPKHSLVQPYLKEA